MKRIRIVSIGLVTIALLGGCQTAYYGAMEKVGVHKRDIMVGRVKDARDAQSDAKEEFKDALTLFSEVVKVDGGDLEKTYDKLSDAFERSEKEAAAVHGRIDSVEDVAKALFKEWNGELKQYSNGNLRRESKRQYDETMAQYKQLMKTMRSAAATMDPVLAAFRDQVLFLKHNLNSRAIASIQSEAAQVEEDVARLIREMEASIAEADAFIKELGVL